MEKLRYRGAGPPKDAVAERMRRENKSWWLRICGEGVKNWGIYNL